MRAFETGSKESQNLPQV